jgi:glycosyltransferase involved in cell wall biosynthesis
MIRAVARLRKSIADLRYLIIGDGALRPELEALSAELGVADIVKFCGWVGQAELSAAYERATVFAMPSSKEGFGIVYLEAWQRGLPVICSKAGASSEVVTDGVDGFVVDPADISMICDRLQTLLSRPELCQAMSVHGRRKVEAKYLHSAFEANLNAILDDLALPPDLARPAIF